MTFLKEIDYGSTIYHKPQILIPWPGNQRGVRVKGNRAADVPGWLCVANGGCMVLSKPDESRVGNDQRFFGGFLSKSGTINPSSSDMTDLQTSMTIICASCKKEPSSLTLRHRNFCKSIPFLSLPSLP